MTETTIITPKERVQILLAEYATLRAEIVMKGAAQFQVATVAGTATIAILGFTVATQTLGLGAILLLATVTFLVIALRFIDFDTRLAAARIREIEASVNALAEEKLLVWETEKGLLSIGYGKRWRRILGLPPN